MNESEDVQCPICGSMTRAENLQEVEGTIERLERENTRLRAALEYVASDVFCCSLEKATEMARRTLAPYIESE